MSKAILYRRRGRRQQSGAVLGRDIRLPRILVGQLAKDNAHAAILAGPQPANSSADMQDPANPEQLYFVPGISVPGGPDLMV